MTRYLTYPLNPTILHWDIRIETLRDDPVDEGRSVFFQEFNLLFLLLDEVINLGCLLVKERNDLFLFGERW
jgi:hypothetical protein